MIGDGKKNKGWEIIEGGNGDKWVFVARKLPETLQLLDVERLEAFLSCVVLQLFVHSMQSANAKAIRAHR